METPLYRFPGVLCSGGELLAARRPLTRYEEMMARLASRRRPRSDDDSSSGDSDDEPTVPPDYARDCWFLELQRELDHLSSLQYARPPQPMPEKGS